ncbi:MAG: hypothetical protein IIV96_03165 [Ruminococcus sp.]|nr:hypothetical protein [Ruminococcus sp.]
MAKIEMQFDGFTDVIHQLEQLEVDVRETVTDALQEAGQFVTEQARAAIQPHGRTGKTEASLRENPTVEWTGTEAAVNVGFDINNGGLPSIFLMYGTPRMKKDIKLYNAVYGAETKKKIEQIERDALNAAVEKAMRGG